MLLQLLVVLVCFSSNAYCAAAQGFPRPPRSDDGILFSLGEINNLQNPDQYFYEGEIEREPNYRDWMLETADHLKELYNRTKTEGGKLGLVIGRGNKEQAIPEHLSPGTVWVYNNNNGEQLDRRSPLPHIYGDLTKTIGLFVKSKEIRFNTLMTDWEVPKFFKTYDLLKLIENTLAPGGTLLTSGTKGWKYNEFSSLDFSGFQESQVRASNQWHAIAYRSGGELHVRVYHSPAHVGPIAMPRPEGEVVALASLTIKSPLIKAELDGKSYYDAELKRQSQDTSSDAWAFVEVLRSLSKEEKEIIWKTTTYHILSAVLGSSFESCDLVEGEYPYPGNDSPDSGYENNKTLSSIRCTGFKGNFASIGSFVR